MSKTFFGFNAKVYRNTGTFGTPVWDEIGNVRDCTLTLEATDANVTARNSGGFKQSAAALIGATVDFSMVYDTTDADWTALKTAFLARSTVDCLIVDSVNTTAGAQGLRADFAILKFTRTENLDEALMTQVTLKPGRSDNAPSWYTSV